MNWRFLCQVSWMGFSWGRQPYSELLRISGHSLVRSREVTKKSRCNAKDSFSVSQFFFSTFFWNHPCFHPFFSIPLIFQFVLNLSRELRQEVACMSRMLLCWRLLAAATWMRNKNGVSIGNFKKRQRLGFGIFPNLRFVFFLFFFEDVCVFFLVILLHWIGNTEHVSQEQTAVGKERRRLARVAGLGRASVRGPGNPPSFGWVWHWKVKLMSIVGGTYAQL